ncbi:hypothetical protein CC2G_001271 [Coprinopsis cinerea AmutBmut pab1-1]|nr:hypothetical protein CC2G_001271 [Coprinopsis cinerea AmutBmut pab1-1]
MSPPTSPPEYMRPSPVRGQLEPYDSKAPNGWRYIQTTDTPGEFKVLLPPGTAAMYEQLLKLENYELTKKPTSINWERIMEIRHLKDRMIRKCQRLAGPHGSSRKISRGEPFVFQTLVAPSDFRLKEMEKWFRDQQKKVVAARRTSTGQERDRGDDTTRRHAGTSSGAQPRLPSSSKPQLLIRAPPNIPGSSKDRSSSATIPSKPVNQQLARVSRAERSVSLPTPTSRPASTPRVSKPTPAAVLSPLPLPVLLLSQREEYGLPADAPVDPSEKPAPLLPLPPDSPQTPNGEPSSSSPRPAPNPTSPTGDIPSDGSSGAKTSDDANGAGGSNGQGVTLGPDGKPLRRRRSCIKRSSMSDLVKTVSWADAPQDLDKQAQNSGTWTELRTLYTDQIKSLESLHEQVTQGLDHLQAETEHLQRIEEGVRRQREVLEKAFKEFEDRSSLFKDKVQEALTEANDNLARVGSSTGNGNGSSSRPVLPPIDEN